MRIRAVVYVVGMVMALVVGVAIGGWGSDRDEGGGSQAGPAPRVVDIAGEQLVGLVTEDSCPELLSWFKENGKAVYGEYGALEKEGAAATAGGRAAGGVDDVATADALSESAAPPAAPGAREAGVDFSTTNVQEAGVDETDIVKTDGSRLVTLASGHLRVVDLSNSAKPVLRSSLPLDGVSPTSLLLVDDRVLVFGSEFANDQPVPLPGRPAISDGVASDMIAPEYFGVSKTAVVVVDVSDVSAPKVVSKVVLDGTYVSARLVDGVARIVLRSQPAFMQQGKAIESTEVGDWLPSYSYSEPGSESASADGRLVPCDNVHHPIDVRDPSTITVLSLDPEDPRPGNGASIAGAGEIVYASPSRMYVSTSRWASDTGVPGIDLHAFDITDKVLTRYVGSGAVAGTLLNQFSLSEHKGFLRAATTTMSPTGQTESQVVVLELKDGGLHIVGSLAGLGKTEQIYAVRFLGDLGYVVTFRQTDPLYVVDLSDPRAPSLKGELKIPGFSSYLHPIGDGRLLGIGQNASAEGRRSGSQVSLFDVSDPSAPAQLSTFPLGSFSSEAEYDHHAFLWWGPSSLAVVPVEVGAVGVRVDGASLVAHGSSGGLRHPTGFPIRRSLVVGSSLLTLSESGVSTVRLADFGSAEWLPF